MANETTVQTSSELDDCLENVPPEVEKSRLKVQVDALGYASAQPSGGKEPLSETCTFSTPVSAINRKKSQSSGFQSALTPILKYLNIGNRCPSPDPSKCGSNPHLSVPIPSLGVPSANCQKAPSGSSQHTTLGLTSSNFGQSLRDKDSPQRWLDEECLPEMTLFDVTCDSTMQMTRNDSAQPDSAPATPVKPGSGNSTLSTNQPSQLRSSTDMVNPLQTNVSSSKAEMNATDHGLVSKQNHTFDNKPSNQNGTIPFSETSSSVSHKNTKVCIALTRANENMSDIHLHKPSKHNNTAATMALNPMDDLYFSEITLLDVSRDSEQSPGAEISSMDVTQDIPQVDTGERSTSLSELAGITVEESVKVDVVQTEELSRTFTGSVGHTTSSFSEQSQCEGAKIKSPLEVTRDISMVSVSGNSTSSSEPSGRHVGKSQTAEETLEIHTANVTHDRNSPSDTSLKNSTSELHGKPVETSNCVEANGEDLCTSHGTESTCETPQTSPKTSGSMDGTFTVVQPSERSPPSNLNVTDHIPAPQNQTLDLPPSDMSSPKAESEAKNQVSLDLRDTTGTSLDVNQTSSAAMTGYGDVPNLTFDRHSLHKSSGTINTGEAIAATFCLQNNTFDSQPSKQNGTITLSETSSSKSPQITMGKTSPSKVRNPTAIHKDGTPEVHPMEVSEQKGSTASSTRSEAKVVGTTESTVEAHPGVEEAPAAGGRQTKDDSRSVTDGLSDSLGHHGMDTEINKATTFNLDDTLDLKADSLVTSTPMPQCKVFHISTGPDAGKAIGAQKKLYGDGPGKPIGQVPTDVPSNIVSDRKTFLTQPAAKSLLPPLKAASHLLKYKSTSTLAERCEPVTAGLPMTRQRTQTEAVRNSADSEATPGTTGMSNPYNLRPTTIGYKQANSGLPRPHLSGLASGIHRAAPGLRMPSARSCVTASLGTDKLHGPTATNPVTKISQPKKHILTRAEHLPTAKRKKIDAPLPATSADASTSSSDAVNGPKNLKQPATVQRALPPKTQRNDAAMPASTAEISKAISAACRARALKQPANVHRAQLSKPQGHGCAKCVMLEEQLKIKSEEIGRLKEELLKYSKQEDEY